MSSCVPVLSDNFDLITHQLEDLKQDITEIKESVKSTCGEVSEIKERVIRMEIEGSYKKESRESSIKILAIVIPCIISSVSIIVAKISGFIH